MGPASKLGTYKKHLGAGGRPGCLAGTPSVVWTGYKLFSGLIGWSPCALIREKSLGRCILAFPVYTPPGSGKGRVAHPRPRPTVNESVILRGA